MPRPSGQWSVISGEGPWHHFHGFFWPEWGLELWQRPHPRPRPALSSHRGSAKPPWGALPSSRIEVSGSLERKEGSRESKQQMKGWCRGGGVWLIAAWWRNVPTDVCGSRAPGAGAVSAPHLQGCRLLPVRCGAKSRLCAFGLEWPAGPGWGR